MKAGALVLGVGVLAGVGAALMRRSPALAPTSITPAASTTPPATSAAPTIVSPAAPSPTVPTSAATVPAPISPAATSTAAPVLSPLALPTQPQEAQTMPTPNPATLSVTTINNGRDLRIVSSNGADVVRLRLHNGTYSPFYGEAGGTFVPVYGMHVDRASVAAVEWRNPFQQWVKVWGQ